jgi:hypothetical protein
MIYPAVILASAWYLALKDHAIAAVAPSLESVSAKPNHDQAGLDTATTDGAGELRVSC